MRDTLNQDRRTRLFGRIPIDQVTRDFLLLSVAWSFSPLLVKAIVHDLPEQHWMAPVIAALLAMTLSPIVLFAYGHLRPGRELRFPDPRHIEWSSKTGVNCIGYGIVSHCLYPALYFSALAYTTIPTAVVLNYTWPAIAALVDAYTKTDKRSVTFARFLGAFLVAAAILLVFQAAGLGWPTLWRIVRAATGSGQGFADMFHRVSVTKYVGLPCALVGAACWGWFTASVPGLEVKTKRGQELSAEDKYLLLSCIGGIAAFFLLITLLAFGWLLHGTAILYFDARRALLVLLYCLVCSAYARLLFWRVSTQLRPTTRNFAFYLVPCLTVLWLVAGSYFHLGSNLMPSAPRERELLLCAFSAILVVGYLRGQLSTPMSPLLALLAALVVAHSLSALISPDFLFPSPHHQSRDTLLYGIQALAALFAIVGGFTLSRSIERFFREQETLLHVHAAAEDVVRLATESPAWQQPVRRLVVTLWDSIVTHDSFGPVRPWAFALPAEAMKESRRRLRTIGQGLDVDKETVERGLRQLELLLAQWQQLKCEIIPRHEHVALTVLAAGVAFLSYSLPTNHEGIWAFVFQDTMIAAAAWILAAIRDFACSRPRNLLRTAYLCQANRGFWEPDWLYLPETVYDRLAPDPRASDHVKKLIVLCSDEGTPTKERPLPADGPLAAAVGFALLAAIGATCLATIFVRWQSAGMR